jgi:hypothetical protein
MTQLRTILKFYPVSSKRDQAVTYDWLKLHPDRRAVDAVTATGFPLQSTLRILVCDHLELQIDI